MENKHTRSVSLIDGHIEKMTDAEIIKALECCSKDNCEECPANGLCDNDDYCFTGDIFDLIKRQQEQIKKLETIERFATKTVEKQEKEIEKLNVELVGMRGACESYKMHYDNAQIEIERLTIRNKALTDITKNYDWKFSKVKAEAIKEVDNLVKEMTEVKKIENTKDN